MESAQNDKGQVKVNFFSFWQCCECSKVLLFNFNVNHNLHTRKRLIKVEEHGICLKRECIGSLCRFTESIKAHSWKKKKKEKLPYTRRLFLLRVGVVPDAAGLVLGRTGLCCAAAGRWCEAEEPQREERDAWESAFLGWHPLAAALGAGRGQAEGSTARCGDKPWLSWCLITSSCL